MKRPAPASSSPAETAIRVRPILHYLTVRLRCPNAIDPARVVRDIVTAKNGRVKRLSVRAAVEPGQSTVVIVFRPESLTSAAETLSAFTEVGDVAFERAPDAQPSRQPGGLSVVLLPRPKISLHKPQLLRNNVSAAG